MCRGILVSYCLRQWHVGFAKHKYVALACILYRNNHRSVGRGEPLASALQLVGKDFDMRKFVALLFAASLLSVTAVQAQFLDWFVLPILSLTNSVQTVKSIAGPWLGYNCYNPNAAQAWVQIFDAATSGAVTLGTTPPNRTIPLAPSTTTGQQVPSPPYSVLNGMQVAATTTQNGSTAPSAPVSCEFYYR